jgi:hypothetical protein
VFAVEGEGGDPRAELEVAAGSGFGDVAGLCGVLVGEMCRERLPPAEFGAFLAREVVGKELSAGRLEVLANGFRRFDDEVSRAVVGGNVVEKVVGQFGGLDEKGKKAAIDFVVNLAYHSFRNQELIGQLPGIIAALREKGAEVGRLQLALEHLTTE